MFSQWSDLTLVRFYQESGTCLVFSAVLAGSAVLVKMLKSDAKLIDPCAEEQFSTELSLHEKARSASPHRSQHIVTFIARSARSGNGRSGNGQFAVFERLPETLQDRLHAYRSFSISKMVPNKINKMVPKFMKQKWTHWTHSGWQHTINMRASSCLELAKAVDYCHRDLLRGSCVLHRAVNPANIGFRDDGSCVLTDLGNAKVMEGFRADVREEAPREMEVPREMTGGVESQRYQSPEMNLHNPYGSRSDVYSWGVCAWEMLSLQTPYCEVSEADFLVRVVEGGERLDVDGFREWPEALRELLKQCLENEPMDRPTMGEVVEALEAIILIDL